MLDDEGAEVGRDLLEIAVKGVDLILVEGLYVAKSHEPGESERHQEGRE